MRSLARFSVRHRLLVVALWVAAIASVQAVVAAVGTDYRNEFALEGTDSQAALDLLEDRFPDAAGDADRVVWQVDDGQVTDEQVRSAVEPALAEIEELGAVLAVTSPYDSPQGALQISDDGRTAFANVQYTGDAVELPREDIEELAEIVDELDEGDLTAGVGGQGISLLTTPEVGPTEILGIAFAAAVLFLAFGSLVAMTLPIISAIAALGVGIGIVSLLTNVVTVSDVAPVLGILLGLGVGIDYALFIVNRFRGNLLAGRDVESAVVASINTSGRAVVFAGITVCIALAGIFVVGVSFLYGLAIGAGVAVLCTVATAVTLLPAMLGLFGTRLLSRSARRQVAAGDFREEHGKGIFRRWADLVTRRPALLSVTALAALAVVASPVLDLRLGAADQGNDPDGTTTRVAYDMLAEGFGEGFNGPLLVTADLSDNPLELPPAGAVRQAPDDPPPGAAGESPGSEGQASETERPPGAEAPAPPSSQTPSPEGATPEAAGPGDSGPPEAPPVPEQLSGLVSGLREDPGVAEVVGPLPNEDGTAALVQVVPTTSPQAEETSDLVDRIRGDYAADAAAQDVTVNVGGPVATFDDFADEIAGNLPLFFSVVIGLSVLLLIVAFRSLLIPIIGAVMNLVSAAAAFGVIVAVFQWGWAADLIGVGTGGPIEPFLPVILFALLFGLSMDYQVFLVSRMAEEWHAGRPNREAVRIGHADTGKVIAAAASIMVFVFGGFIFGDSRTIKLLGLGMAAAVAMDAFVIRSLVVPSIMHRLGAANWWLPGWLDRVLPRISIEAHEDEPRQVATTSVGPSPAGRGNGSVPNGQSRASHPVAEEGQLVSGGPDAGRTPPDGS